MWRSQWHSAATAALAPHGLPALAVAEQLTSLAGCHPCVVGPALRGTTHERADTVDTIADRTTPPAAVGHFVFLASTVGRATASESSDHELKSESQNFDERVAIVSPEGRRDDAATASGTAAQGVAAAAVVVAAAWVVLLLLL